MTDGTRPVAGVRVSLALLQELGGEGAALTACFESKISPGLDCWILFFFPPLHIIYPPTFFFFA